LLGYLALTLLPVAALLYLIWSHRRREAERAAASRKRFAEMFGAATGEKSAPPTVAGAAGTSPSVAAPRPPAAAPLCEKNERLLDARHAALHSAVSQAMSGFQVFPHVSLAALVRLPAALPGREREQRLRALAQQTVDCVVCSERMEIVAAIDRENGASAESRIKSQYLAAAGVPYLRLDPAALPAPDDIRKHVLAPGERSPA